MNRLREQHTLVRHRGFFFSESKRSVHALHLGVAVARSPASCQVSPVPAGTPSWPYSAEQERSLREKEANAVNRVLLSSRVEADAVAAPQTSHAASPASRSRGDSNHTSSQLTDAQSSAVRSQGAALDGVSQSGSPRPRSRHKGGGGEGAQANVGRSTSSCQGSLADSKPGAKTKQRVCSAPPLCNRQRLS